MIDPRVTELDRLRGLLKMLQDNMASGILRMEDVDTGVMLNRSYPEMRMAESDLFARIRGLELQLNPMTVRRTRQVVMIGRSGW